MTRRSFLSFCAAGGAAGFYGASASSLDNPFSRYSIFVNENSSAARWVAANGSDARSLTIAKIAAKPTGLWMTSSVQNIKADVQQIVTAASMKNELPVLVAYNIPGRDCGGYSAGGMNPNGYRIWISQFAEGIGPSPAVVILEPDALAMNEPPCFVPRAELLRYELLRYATQTFSTLGNTFVYIDAGHPAWKTPGEMADRLFRAGVSLVRGFSVNVSNFATTSDCLSYGDQVTALLQGPYRMSPKYFVVDTSRNGNGVWQSVSNREPWCNPPGRALGQGPGQTGAQFADAFLWVKPPGESDGACNGGPPAGVFWPDYAVALAQAAGW